MTLLILLPSHLYLYQPKPIQTFSLSSLPCFPPFQLVFVPNWSTFLCQSTNPHVSAIPSPSTPLTLLFPKAPCLHRRSMPFPHPIPFSLRRSHPFHPLLRSHCFQPFLFVALGDKYKNFWVENLSLTIFDVCFPLKLCG